VSDEFRTNFHFEKEKITTTLLFIFCFVEKIAVPKKNTNHKNYLIFFGKVILSVYFAILPSTCNFPAFLGLSMSRTATIQPAKIEDEHKFSLCLCFVHACIV